LNDVDRRYCLLQNGVFVPCSFGSGFVGFDNLFAGDKRVKLTSGMQLGLRNPPSGFRPFSVVNCGYSNLILGPCPPEPSLSVVVLMDSTCTWVRSPLGHQWDAELQHGFKTPKTLKTIGNSVTRSEHTCAHLRTHAFKHAHNRMHTRMFTRR
jgi:hypothetical protein